MLKKEKGCNESHRPGRGSFQRDTGDEGNGASLRNKFIFPPDTHEQSLASFASSREKRLLFPEMIFAFVSSRSSGAVKHLSVMIIRGESFLLRRDSTGGDGPSFSGRGERKRENNLGTGDFPVHRKLPLGQI